MATGEMFDSNVRSSGDLAGVFEYDDDTGYFYLYETGGGETHRILDSIHVLSGEPDFREGDISIRWDPTEQKVGLFIRGTLWAVFDHQQRAKYGGGYKAELTPALPPQATIGLVVSARK